MYWKLVDELEFDFGETPMKTSTFIAAVMARNKQEAHFWFTWLHSNGCIYIPSSVLRNMDNYISECSLEDYLKFIDSIK